MDARWTGASMSWSGMCPVACPPSPTAREPAIVRVASPPDWQYHEPLLGMRRAMEIMLTGEDITGTEAAAKDLVVGASYVHTFQQNGLPVTITRTFAEEMTNYANWFAYYRTRLQAAKTVISHNFALA